MAGSGPGRNTWAWGRVPLAAPPGRGYLLTQRLGEAQVHDHELRLPRRRLERGGIRGPLYLEPEPGRRLTDLGDEDEVPHEVDDRRHAWQRIASAAGRRDPTRVAGRPRGR